MTALSLMDPRDHVGTAPPFAPAVIAPADMAGVWFVAQVQPTKARWIAGTLDRVEGFQSYLPMESVKREYGDRVVRSWTKAAIPGYLFANCKPDTEAEYALRRLREGITAIITVRDQARFARELQSFHLLHQSGGVQRYGLPLVGQRCRIKTGEMAGVEGELVSTTNRWLFVVKIGLIAGQAWCKRVPPEHLEVLDEAAA